MSTNNLDNFFTIEFDLDQLQPVLIHKLFGTSYFLSGKFFTIKKKGKRFLKKIYLKYQRTNGLINFSIENIIVDRRNDPIIGKEIIHIQVYFRAFKKTSDTDVYFKELSVPIRISDQNEFIHVNPVDIADHIADLDIDDDITPFKDDITNDVPCRSKIKNEGP